MFDYIDMTSFIDIILYTPDKVDVSSFSNFIVPLIASVLGAGITALISWRIFKQTSDTQLIRDQENYERQLKRDAQNQKENEKLKAINLIIELQLILNGLTNRKRILNKQGIFHGAQINLSTPIWQKMSNSMSEAADIKDIDTKDFQPLFKCHQHILIGKIKVLIKNYNKLERHIYNLNEDIRKFQENKLFQYTIVNDDLTLGVKIEDDIKTEYYIRTIEYDASIMDILLSLEKNITDATNYLNSATNILRGYFNEADFLNITYNIQ